MNHSNPLVLAWVILQHKDEHSGKPSNNSVVSFSISYFFQAFVKVVALSLGSCSYSPFEFYAA